MNKRTNSKENDTISKKTGNKARQLSIYFLQAISLIALLFCVWLLTREKEYREIDVNTVAQNLVELMPDTVVSESDMVVKERFGLEANAFNGLVYYGPDSNMDAAELLLVNLKDTSQKESVEEAIQKRIEYQKSCFEGYGCAKYRRRCGTTPQSWDCARPASASPLRGRGSARAAGKTACAFPGG